MSATPLNGLAPADAERLDELLADRAVFGLDDAETAELAQLLAKAGREADETYDLIAASAAVVPEGEQLPAVLRDRVLDDHADRPSEPAKAVPAAPPAGAAAAKWPILTMLAVAAGVLISINLGGPTDGPSPAKQRATLIAEADDLVRLAWSPQQDPALAEIDGDNAYGDVVWSDQRQAGYMRFVGLQPNDPTVEQYQLWVFDEQRSADYPVDGGVFDISADGEAIVPIDVKLSVTKATLFAITVEKPGGAVVSDRSRLPLLAQR